MKKQIMTITMALVLVTGGATLTSCTEESEETVTEQEADGAEEAEATHVHYACPMDCEDGKTYEEPGSCPVCHMDLKEVE